MFLCQERVQDKKYESRVNISTILSFGKIGVSYVINGDVDDYLFSIENKMVIVDYLRFRNQDS